MKPFVSKTEPSKPRLSGAARKRLRRYLDMGYSQEEAQKECLKPWPIALRRSTKTKMKNELVALGMSTKEAKSIAFPKLNQLNFEPPSSVTRSSRRRHSKEDARRQDYRSSPPRQRRGRSRQDRASSSTLARSNSPTYYPRSPKPTYIPRSTTPTYIPRSTTPSYVPRPITPTYFPMSNTAGDMAVYDVPEVLRTANQYIASQEANATPGDIAVRIMPLHYPQELLSIEQQKAIQEAILEKIIDARQKTFIKPSFHRYQNKDGWLSLRCADRDTFEWLNIMLPGIQSWYQGPALKLEIDEYPLDQVLVAYVPGSEEYTNGKILQLIEAQNEGLNTQYWRVLSRVPKGSIVELALSVDQESVEKLCQNDYFVNYRFGRIRLIPNESNPPSRDEPSQRNSGMSRSPQPRYYY